MFLIGLTGKKRAGKDTFAKAAKELIGDSVQTVSFASPIKEITKILFDLTDEEIEKNKEKPILYDVSPRVFMQQFGTELCRNLFGEDIWVDLLFNKINKMNKEIIIITDVRFNNEAKRIKKNNGLIIQIERENYHHHDFHISEKGIDPSFVDFIFENSGTIEEYNNKCKMFFEKLYSNYKERL